VETLLQSKSSWLPLHPPWLENGSVIFIRTQFPYKQATSFLPCHRLFPLSPILPPLPAHPKLYQMHQSPSKLCSLWPAGSKFSHSTLKEQRLRFHGQWRNSWRRNCRPHRCIAFAFKSDIFSQVQWHSRLMFGAEPKRESGVRCEGRRWFLSSPCSRLSVPAGWSDPALRLPSPPANHLWRSRAGGRSRGPREAARVRQRGWLNLCKPLCGCMLSRWGPQPTPGWSQPPETLPALTGFPRHSLHLSSLRYACHLGNFTWFWVWLQTMPVSLLMTAA